MADKPTKIPDKKFNPADLLMQIAEHRDQIAILHVVVHYKDGSAGVYKTDCPMAQSAMAIAYMQHRLLRDIEPTAWGGSEHLSEDPESDPHVN